MKASFFIKDRLFEGIPWWPSGSDSVLPLQGAWVRSVVEELRSPKMCGEAEMKRLFEMNSYLR